MSKNRKNKRFDVDSIGIRTEWARNKYIYDAFDRLPNDSESQKESIRLYVAQLINDYERYGYINTKNTQFFFPSGIRDSDGFGSSLDSSWLNFTSSGDWTDAYKPLFENIYGKNNDVFLGTAGGARHSLKRRVYNIMALDSDGRQYSMNFNTMLKLHTPTFIENDYYEKRRMNDAIREVFVADSDIDLFVADARFKNFETSNIRISETEPNRITTLSGDLELGSATSSITANGDFTVSGTFSIGGGTGGGGSPTKFSNPVIVEGPLTANNPVSIQSGLSVSGNSVLGDSEGVVHTINGTSTFNDNVVVGSAAVDTLVVNASSDFNTNVNVDGALTATSTATVTGITTLNGGLTMDSDLFTVADGTGNVHTSGTLDVDGNTNLDGTLQVDGAANLSNSLTVAGAATLNGNTTLGNVDSDTLTVNATSDFNAGVNVDGNLTTTANTTLGNTSSDALTVNATSDFNAGVNVDGATTLNGNVTLGDSDADTITVKGTMSFANPPTYPVQALALTGPVTGSTTYNGSGGWTINTAVNAGTGIIIDSDSIAASIGLQSVHNAVATVSGTGLIQVTAANTVSQLADGAENQVLKTDGAGTLSWFTIPSGGGEFLYFAGNGIEIDDSEIRMSGSYTGDFTVTGNITATSDRRLKSDLEVIPDAIDKINNLNGYTFTKDEQRATGVIAQEVQAVLPEAVKETENGYLSVAYGNMVGLLIEGMKEQQKQIDQLKEEIERLK